MTVSTVGQTIVFRGLPGCVFRVAQPLRLLCRHSCRHAFRGARGTRPEESGVPLGPARRVRAPRA